MVNPKHRILVLKMDLKAHYEWFPKLIWNDGHFRMSAWSSPRDLLHHTKSSTFTFHNDAIEMFWSNLPFSIGLSYDKDTDNLDYYCNIHLPCSMESEEETTFIDLDLDVVKHNQNFANTVDWDEFETHSHKYNYSKEIIEKVPAIANELESLLDNVKDLQPQRLIKTFKHVFKTQNIQVCSLEEIKPYSILMASWPKELLLSNPSVK